MISLTYSIADQNVATTKSIGIYNFSIRLARELSRHPEVSALTVLSNHTASKQLDVSAKARVIDHDSAIASKLRRIKWDQWGCYRAARETNHDWLLLPKGFASFAARPPMPLAAYVHDIMGDYYRRRFPGFEPRLEYEYFARCLAATLRTASVIFTNSDFTRRELTDLAKRRGLPTPRMVVAGYGFDAPETTDTKKENRVLLFASKVPHKRTDIALRFLKQWLEASHYDGVIDCIGIHSPDMEKPEGPSWNWIGRVPPAQGREMIRRSRAVVYVSEYEGFGMPTVEAALEGTCPVFSDIPPIREVMGDAGCAFSNDSAESLIAAMNQALATPRELVQSWAKQLLARHNWTAVTDRIVAALRRDSP